MSVAEAKRRVLHACEATVERLARDPHYFARPSQSLFSEVRHFFSISDQARVYRSIDRNITTAVDYILEEIERARRRHLILPGNHAQGKAVPAHAAPRPRVLPLAPASRRAHHRLRVSYASALTAESVSCL